MRWTCGSSWWWIDSSPGESGLAPKRDSDVLLPRERGTLPETRAAPDHHVTCAPLARLKGIDPSLDKTASAGGAQVAYLFTRDRGRTSACSGACASAWPPVLTKATPAIGPGLRARAGTTRRRGGARQATYGGHPLYYYIGDARPGQILCQDVAEVGGTWLIVSPRGLAVR